MSKVKFLDSRALESIKDKQGEEILRHVIIQGDRTLQDFFDSEVIHDSGIDASEFRLDPGKSEADNAINCYEALKRMPRNLAADERVWGAYSLSDQLSYMTGRWKIAEIDLDKPKGMQSFLKSYLLSGPRKGWVALTLNGISRLWWAAALSYDKSRSDPYELTRILCSNTDYFVSILQRNMCHNTTFLHGVLEGMIDVGDSLNILDVRETMKYFNILGGTRVLDCFDQQEIRKMTAEWLKEAANKRKNS